METQERQLVLEQFFASRNRLEKMVEGLTPEQWNFHEAPERWSITQIIEHVIAVETRIIGAIQKILDKPADDRERTSTREEDALIQRRATDRSVKLSAPAAVHPTGKFADSAELMAAFRATRDRTTAFAAETQGDLRGHIIPHMAFGDLDCYQWLVLLGQHGHRHALQIEEIKANAAYPRQSTVAAV